jgi:septin family protein
MSKSVKTSFKKNELSKGMLISIGQFTHKMTTRMTIWSAGYKVRSIQPLEKEAALSAGAEFVGEAFIFTVGGAAVVWEYNKSKEKERAKEEENRVREKLQEERLNDLQNRMTEVEKSLKRNMHSLDQILGSIERERQLSLGHDRGRGIGSERGDDEPEIVRKRGWLW